LSGNVGRHLGVRNIFTERINNKMELRRGFHIEPSTRILIVEDIVTTGGSVQEMIQITNDYNAEIIGVAGIVDRSSIDIDFGVKFSSLLKIPIQSWPPENCPLCLSSIPFTSRGRTGKS